VELAYLSRSLETVAMLESQLRESNAKLAGLELALEAAEKLAAHWEQECSRCKLKVLELESGL